jgi:hypothetical protein
MPKSAGGYQRDPESVPPRLPPARTRERRSQQLIAYAEDLLEERLRTGKASPTEVVSVLRMGTEIERANIERIKAHTAYLEAQKAKAESETFREQKFQEAMEAMARYSGEGRD